MDTIAWIKGQIASAVQAHQKVNAQDLKQILTGLEQQGGVTPDELKVLQQSEDAFDDTARVGLEPYLAADEDPDRVEISGGGTVTALQGRYANLLCAIPGMSAKLGLFDNVYSLSGVAQGSGTLALTVDGTPISVSVSPGDDPAKVLAQVQAQLPADVKGVLLAGDVQPLDLESLTGAAPAQGQTAAHLALYKPAALQLQPGELPLHVVVTGYGAFMGITDNASDDMAVSVTENGIPGAVVDYERLDVTTQAVNDFVSAMQQKPPDVIISMGQAPAAQIEELPENRLDAGVDGNNNPLTPGPIDPTGPLTENVDLPLPVINWTLDHDFGAQRVIGSSESDPNYQPDRSAYLCNYLGYKLAKTFTGTPTAAGFVHVTATTPPAQMEALIESVVASKLEDRRNPPPTH